MSYYKNMLLHRNHSENKFNCNNVWLISGNMKKIRSQVSHFPILLMGAALEFTSSVLNRSASQNFIALSVSIKY